MKLILTEQPVDTPHMAFPPSDMSGTPDSSCADRNGGTSFPRQSFTSQLGLNDVNESRPPLP